MSQEIEPKKLRKFLFFAFPAFLYAGLIFYLSAMQGGFPSIGFKSIDKVVHILEFSVLGWLITRAFHFGKLKPVSSKFIFISIVIGILYGASDEIHQLFVLNRSSEILDWLADCIGVILGTVGYRHFNQIERKLIKLGEE